MAGATHGWRGGALATLAVWSCNLPADPALEYRHGLIRSSIAAGVASVGGVHLIGGALHNPDDLLHIGLGEGDALVWVGTCGSRELPFWELRRKGVRLVYYQADWSAQGECQATAELHELWTYSHAILDWCNASKAAVVLRYIPPAASPPVALDRSSAAVTPPAMWGTIEMHPAACWSRLTRQGGGLSAPIFVNRAFDNAALARYTEQIAIFMFIGCAAVPARQPIDFNIFQLLSFQTIVISEHVHPKDEAALSYVVHFETLESLGEAHMQYQRMSQSHRLSVAESRWSSWMFDNSPHAVMKHAGVYDMLSTLLSVRDPGGSMRESPPGARSQARG